MNARPGHKSTDARRRVQPLWNALDNAIRCDAVLAISGGDDSLALLEACATWSGRFLQRLLVASVDHGVRPEGAAEVDAVIAMARAYAFDAHSLWVDAAKSDEASLRKARYHALFSFAHSQGITTVVTAHHLGDVAEAELLTALGHARLLGRKSQVIIRPFIALPQATLVRARFGRAFVDPDHRSARAQIRHRLSLTPAEERALSAHALRRQERIEALPLLSLPAKTSSPRAVFRKSLPQYFKRRPRMNALNALLDAVEGNREGRYNVGGVWFFIKNAVLDRVADDSSTTHVEPRRGK